MDNRDAESTLASLCDYLNTYARECGVKEAKWYSLEELREVIDRIIYAERLRNQKLTEKNDELKNSIQISDLRYLWI